jgi:Na+/proline symporter
MNWHDLDLAALTLIVASLLWRRHIYRYVFRETRDEIIESSINRKTTIAVLIVVANLLIFLADAAGLLSARNFWSILLISGVPSILFLFLFIAHEIALIKDKRRKFWN